MGVCSSCDKPSIDQQTAKCSPCPQSESDLQKFTHISDSSAGKSDQQMGEASSQKLDKAKHWSRQTVFASPQPGSTTKRTRSKKNEQDAELVRNAIQQSTLLGAMLLPQIDEMIEYMTIVNVKTGIELDLSSGVCVIISGRVKIKHSASSSTCHVYSKGHVMGDTGLLHSK